MTVVDQGKTAIVAVNQVARKWWPLMGSLASVAIVVTMMFVTFTVAQDHAEQVKAREVAEATNEKLTKIVEANRREQETRDERTAAAVEAVREVLTEVVAAHDAQMNRLMARQLEQIAQLLRRPEGIPTDPVSAEPAPSGSFGFTSTSTTSSSPPLTTPDQRSCDRRPSGPRC